MYENHSSLHLLYRITIILGCFVIFWQCELITLATAIVCTGIFAIVFMVFPLIFRYSVTLQRGILFLTFITYPKGLDLSNPSSIGLYATRNFYITVNDPDDTDKTKGVNIGVWHLLPQLYAKSFSRELQIDETEFEELSNATVTENKYIDALEPVLKSEFPIITKDNEQLFYERMLKLPGTIVMYLHGNTASRGSGHRLDTYKMLRKLNYHVFTFDYRSYGDSDPATPTEKGVVQDAFAVFEYIINITSNPIIIWGHSLGTGVGTHLCSLLKHFKERGPRGIILESPFTNIRDEIRLHPFARPFKNLPWFEYTISRPMYQNALRFESDLHISEFRQPVMIIHAEDDYVVPFKLGYKLYRIALDTRSKSSGPVEFHRFDGKHSYGHKYLCRAPELPDLVKNFINNYRDAVF